MKIIYILGLIGVSGLLTLVVRGLRKLPGVNNLFFLAAFPGMVISVYLLIDQQDVASQYESMAGWPRTEAEIIKGEITGRRAVLPRITYSYTVNESTYVGVTDLSTPAFGSRNKRALTAQAVLEAHPVGGRLVIAYDPSEPGRSTTQFHPPWNYYGKMGLAGTLLVFSVFLIVARLARQTS